jgi:hypothetical protein
MLRPRGNGQTDFVLTPQALDDLAKVIWRDFLGRQKEKKKFPDAVRRKPRAVKHPITLKSLAR